MNQTSSTTTVPELNEEELQQRITHDSLEDLFRKIAATSYWQVLLLPLIMVLIMWSRFDAWLLIGWALLVLSSILLRRRLATTFLRRKPPVAEAPQWGRYLSWVSLYSATLWAAAILCFYVPDSVEHQVFVFTLTLTLSIGSLIAGTFWLPASYVFAVPVMGAMGVQLLLTGHLASIALAFFLLSYLLLVTKMARSLHSTVRSEIVQRHKSEALAEALHKKTEEAQQAVLAKSRFLAGASHDLRQPLHTLSLFMDVLKDAKDDAERACIISRLDLSLEALQRLFEALLDVSRLDAGVITPEMEHFDLSGLMRKLAEEFRPAAGDKHLKLKLHATSAVVRSDPLLVERILRNLISNAIRYTEKGGVLLSARMRRGEVLLQVWDTGIGIPVEHQEEVFAEFLQLRGDHRVRSEGLGLGLALVRRLCLLLDLALQLRSEPGNGSVFSIRLPVGDVSLMIDKRAEPTVHDLDLTGRVMLVIDDDTDSLEATQKLLAKWGCRVIIAATVEDAARQSASQNLIPDLLLCDLRLGDGVSGVDAIDTLRHQFGETIPGLLITGETAAESLSRAKESGHHVLQKPIRPALLRTAINRLLSYPPG